MSDIRLFVQPPTVARGSSLTLVLSNESAEEVSYNLCTSELERRDGDSWVPIPSDRMCTMDLRVLEPAAEARFRIELPATCDAGEYRAITSVLRHSDDIMQQVVGASFRIQ